MSNNTVEDATTVEKLDASSTLDKDATDNDDDEYQLPLGLELTLEDIYEISSSEKSKIILFAGAAECGKTTLLTSIYQYFLNAPTGRFYFSGSNTMQALEQRAYFTRMQSRQKNPKMQRTPTGSLESYLHLRLYDTKSKLKKNLIISDFSGEDYQRVIASAKLASEEFKMLRQFQSICLLVDGEKIISKQSRHGEVENLKRLLRTFYDAKLLNTNSKLHILLSKYDLVKQAMDKDDSINTFISTILRNITSVLPASFISKQFFEIAAMPQGNCPGIGMFHGVDKLLESLYDDEVRDRKSVV